MAALPEVPTPTLVAELERRGWSKRWVHDDDELDGQVSLSSPPVTMEGNPLLPNALNLLDEQRLAEGA